MIPESFHFLRPAWLLALVPLALVLWAAARSDERSSAWRRIVDQHLLRHLVCTDGDRAQRWPLLAGTLAGLAAILAMAGPTWQQIPQPTFSNVEPTVVVLDMSPSMRADDLSPSRLGRARHKLQDILDRTRGGQIGLVLYSDEPFVAAPLTDDARVIMEMIPTLESGLMPLRAPRADRAIAQAQALLDQAGTPGGRALLITDGLGEDADAANAAARALAASGRTLSILGAATEAGAPLRDGRGRIVSDHDGKPVMSKLDRSALEGLAGAGGGRFRPLSADDTDLAALVPSHPGSAGTTQTAQTGSSAQFDVWRDAGVWLVLIPLLLAPLAFRRGLVAAVALTVLAASSASADTGAWSDLWSRRDQQAQAARAAGDAAAAATLFEQPEWKAAATYESGNFADSVKSYAKLEGDENHYNLGNALARAGQLEDALKAYDQVLASVPGHADAKFNRDLVQRLLDEQRKQQEQQQKQEQSQQQQGGQGEQKQDAQSAATDSQQGKTEQQKDQQAQNSEQQQGQGSEQREAQQNQKQDGRGTGGEPQQQQAQPPEGQQANEPSDSAQAEQASADKPDDGGNGAQPQAAQADDAKNDDRTAAAHDQAGAEQKEHTEQQAQAPRRAPPAEAQQDDSKDDANARAAKDDNEAAKQDRTLAEGLDQALQGDDQAKDQQHASEQDGDAKQTASSSAKPRPMSEREQAREQALRNIPDDPGGLLRAKIRRQYAEKRYSQQEVNPSW